MHQIARRYATISSGKSLQSKGPVLTLEHFLQRQKVISLWRRIVRAVHQIPPASPIREEMRQYARAEFERYRHVNDISHIRYLYSTGKTQFDNMRSYVEQGTI